MTAIWRKYWIAGLLAGLLLLGIVSAFNVARDIGQPFGGVFVGRAHSWNVWQVEAASPPWWTGFTQARLRYEDVLVKLEDHPYGPQAHRLYAEAWHAGRQTIRLSLLRDGVPMRVDLPLQLFTLSHFVDLKVPDLINGLGFWLLAVAVYRTRPEAPVNRLFAVATGLAAGGIWLSLPAVFPEAGTSTWILQLAWVFPVSFVGSAFIQLAMLFPEPVRRGSLRWLPLMHLLMAVVAGLYALSLIIQGLSGPSPLANQLSRFGNNMVLGNFGLSVGVYVARLLWLTGRRSCSRRIRRQAGFMLLGVVCALPYVVVIIVRSFVQSGPSFFWSGLDWRYLVLAVPLSFAFVILRYQTFQRTPPALIGVFMLAGSALFASLGAWLLRLWDLEGLNALKLPPFVPLLIVAFLSGLFWSTQSSWWGAFSRRFQWERRSYRAVGQFGQQVAGQINLAQLPDTIAAALVARMELEQAAVWLWDEAQMAFTLAGRAGKWPESPPARLSPDSSSTLNQPVQIRAEGEVLPDWLAPLRDSKVVEVVVPLWVTDRPVGLLGLGKRWDDEIFDVRDLEVIDLISQQAALLLLTALQVEQLRQVPHHVATAQERERFNIAQELHDTVQQFLGRLPFFLEVSRQVARTDPAEAEAILQRCIADVESASQTVRQIRNSLAPLQLEKSLVQPLQLLVEHLRSRTGLEMQVDIGPEVDTYLGPDARHALYRVVQQALDNAAAHAQANRVTIILTQANGRIHFAVTDDGSGFSDRQRVQAEDQGSFGLKSMRARITSLGGEFVIESAPGAGTQISGWLPASPPTPGPSPLS